MSTSFLDWTTSGDETAEPSRQLAGHLRAFRVLLLAHVTTQAWDWAIDPLPHPFTLPVLPIRIVAIYLTGLLVLACIRWTRLACLLAIPAVAWETFSLLPGTPNHVFLVFLLLALTSAFDLRRRDERLLLLQALRWVAVVIFVWAGVQKVLHGLYFQGEFLTWMISHGIDRWAATFGWMIPEAEMTRLAALPRFEAGSGPYRVDSWLFIAVANSVWVGEILLGLAMLHRWTREWAALAAIVLVFTIQTAPREFMFAVLYTNVLLLYVRGAPNRRAMVVFVGLYASMFAALLGAPWPFVLKAGGGL